MCGITFHYTHAGGNSDLVEKSLHRLQHRGPDESQLLSMDKACLGHARLSIIDLERSHQPMQTQDGRYALIYNGEIYNYTELRKQLAARWDFVTAGDTEVLLAGLVLEGERFLPRIEGMWAFALWDSATESLLLSRDRMGKKPLYYECNTAGFACASELPALRALTRDSWSEDFHSTADYFRFGYCLPGYTSWQGVFEVLPGHWLRWSPGESIKQQSYWEISLPHPELAMPNDEDLVFALEDAVRKRLVADVEVGAFLSGGIDSSLICALAQPVMNKQLKTYTIGFSDQTFDERNFAEQAARHIGTDHHAEELNNWDESHLESLLMNHLGQPFADASLLPTSLVSKLASQDVKVALSGDGGDELFGGYQRYQARLILRWYTRLPAMLRKYAESALRALPEPRAHHSRSLLKKAHLFLDIAQRYKAETPYTAPLMFHPDEYEKIFPGLSGFGHRPPKLLEETDIDDLQRMLFADTLVYLPQDILVKVDRASMAHGLETRAPLLDHKVVEIAFSQPCSNHFMLGSGKRWLKGAFADRLPAAIWRRRKQGFGVPLHQWFRGELGNRLDAILANVPEIINSDAVKQLLREHTDGRRDNGYRLWMIFVYLTNRAQ
ncbi:MAG: asparagine synthase (glutamine-hydrolyzing) [Candidatus Thiodiazotropha sp. (ex Dulcina madagascariensis)]|nr:asparagine synthase (glutamine-hydrolyzing) [Candidatus Thiodiazotropha sp. (ex Dulcina madagascariensis)]